MTAHKQLHLCLDETAVLPMDVPHRTTLIDEITLDEAGQWIESTATEVHGCRLRDGSSQPHGKEDDGRLALKGKASHNPPTSGMWLSVVRLKPLHRIQFPH
jgi:hypothetical protein